MPQNKAFTLIELMITVVIISILASLAMLNFYDQRRKTEYKSALAQVQAIASAEKAYSLSQNFYPATADTASTNSALALAIQDSYFRNYRVTPGGLTFTISCDGGNAVYTFDTAGLRTSCVGTDCLP